jgi:hypothetical protein
MEYGRALGAPTVRRPTDLLSALHAAPVLVFSPEVVSPESFDFFSHAAWVRGAGLVLVDELASVTHAGKASGWWGRLIREGRHKRIEVAAAAQRPAEIDKTIIGNATRLIVFRLGRAIDRKMMADELDIDRERIDVLEPLEFLDADRLTRQVTQSRIVFA